MKTAEINLRDPFVLAEGDQYYLYGTHGETAFATVFFACCIYFDN